MKNKKSLTIVNSLVSIIIAVVIFLVIILPNGTRVMSAFFGGGSESFEAFVNGIKEMAMRPEKTESFALQLNDKSAIIGFGKDTDAFKCYSCGEGINEDKINKITFKPDNPECNSKACVCLCDSSFETKSGTVSGIPGNVWIGKCNSGLICKTINTNIAGKTIIRKMGHIPGFGSDLYQHWIDGFLFTRGVDNANGLSVNKEEIITLHVQKKESIIGVCNSGMLKFNKEVLGLPENTCINKDSG